MFLKIFHKNSHYRNGQEIVILFVIFSQKWHFGLKMKILKFPGIQPIYIWLSSCEIAPEGSFRIVQMCVRVRSPTVRDVDFLNLGLNFGPQWMRNPPQQEPFPQRTFPLAQYRYGREEMLAIFEQIGSV